MKRKVSMFINVIGLLSAALLLWVSLSIAEIAFYHPAVRHHYGQYNVITMLSDLAKN